ncbi:cell filamentation protein Fic [Candidatus Peregrinibacteria bacterium CG1_02_54_53]|nr:MAG: cell filamentation protein Fic [Candidatus Peregrinibacteria bacterium CG1_02_54_53]
MPFLDPRIRQRLDEKLEKLKALRPLSLAQVQKLRMQMEVEMTYNSNAIEGNSLTLRETYLVLQEGMTIKGKPLKDHLEAKDHKEALDFLYELASHDSQTVSEHLIRQLHQLVVRETDMDWAGRYRTGSVIIGGADHTPPDAIDVPRQMAELMRWLKQHDKKMHAVELAALLHHKVVHIHPFFDGNGRTARLVMNILLMRRGFPLAIILKNDRKKYYRVLQTADKGNAAAFVLLIAQAVERSLDLYLRTFETDGKGRLLTLAEASKGTTYSPKYLNLLARTGRIDAFKKGRVWRTTKEAIESYRAGRLRRRK